MRERISVFSCAAACALAWLSCGVQGPSRTGSGLRFAVVNAGGGLSQMASSGAEAVVFDMGDTGAAQSWKDAYLAAGAPRIRTIVISNSRSAHCGGLSMLPDSTDFSGDIVTSVCEDTALVRAMCGWWASRVRFRTIGAGDTVAGPGGSFALCVWPPRSIALQAPVSGNVKEEYSLCFLLRYQSNTVLVTSDIDTSAQQALSARLGSGLGADMLVLPRNGSGRFNRSGLLRLCRAVNRRYFLRRREQRRCFGARRSCPAVPDACPALSNLFQRHFCGIFKRLLLDRIGGKFPVRIAWTGAVVVLLRRRGSETTQ